MEKEKFFAIKEGDSTGIFRETYSQTLLRHPKEFKSFKTREEAERYMAGIVEEEEVQEPIDCSGLDALIFEDGSLNFDYPKMEGKMPEEFYGSYGLVIFFLKDNKIYDVYYESGKILDHPDPQKEHYALVWRYGMNGERVDRACKPIDEGASPEEFSYKDVYKDSSSESAEKNRQKHRFVLASGSDTAELEGLSRSLEICFDERKLHKVAVVYDAGAAEHIYNGKKNRTKNAPYFYGEKFEKIRTGLGITDPVQFIKVKSHAEGNVYSTFNDCADVLAKAETSSKPIGGGKKQNPNLKAYFEHIAITDKEPIEERRRKSRILIPKVIEQEKSNLL
jgi:hypothetical protein